MSNRPKPTTLKKQEGNPGKRKLNKNEPQFNLGAKIPYWLSASAKTEWKRLAPLLETSRVLTEADRDILASLCEAVASLKKAIAAEKKHKGDYVINRAGNWVLAPWGRMKITAIDTIRKCSVELGLTPAARTKIETLPPVSEGEDLAGKILKYPKAVGKK